ncbi:MAG TPA: DUF2791 family P-loop domain-containing protein, partial [Phycisphaerae bacterium]|nr:DUF2791 family P-loop domain-containing protein [Phycisphaerae bacterium]
MRSITQRERSAVLQSLAAGVVPAVGLPHIQVGRKEEVTAVIEDLKRAESGAAGIRFV